MPNGCAILIIVCAIRVRHWSVFVFPYGPYVCMCWLRCCCCYYYSWLTTHTSSSTFDSIELYTSLYYNYTFLWSHVQFMYSLIVAPSPFCSLIRFSLLTPTRIVEGQHRVVRIFAWPAAALLCFGFEIVFIFERFSSLLSPSTPYALMLIFDRDKAFFFRVCRSQVYPNTHRHMRVCECV